MPRSSSARALFVFAGTLALSWAFVACGGRIDYGSLGDGSGAAGKAGAASSAPTAMTQPIACGVTTTGLGLGCMLRMQGGPGSTSCKPIDLWRTYASDDCAQSGLQLEAAQTCDPCGPDYQTVSYVCCPQPPSASTFDPEDAGPEIDATPPGCHEEADGTPTCQSYDQLKALSAQKCAAEGQSLGLVEVHQKCPDGGYTQVFYTCCI